MKPAETLQALMALEQLLADQPGITRAEAAEALNLNHTQIIELIAALRAAGADIGASPGRPIRYKLTAGIFKDTQPAKRKAKKKRPKPKEPPQESRFIGTNPTRGRLARIRERCRRQREQQESG